MPIEPDVDLDRYRGRADAFRDAGPVRFADPRRRIGGERYGDEMAHPGAGGLGDHIAERGPAMFDPEEDPGVRVVRTEPSLELLP